MTQGIFKIAFHQLTFKKSFQSILEQGNYQIPIRAFNTSFVSLSGTVLILLTKRNLHKFLDQDTSKIRIQELINDPIHDT